MARKFLIDGNWLICSEGTCMQRMTGKEPKNGLCTWKTCGNHE